MGVVGYRCPVSGEAVTTAIKTSKDTLVRMRDLDLTIWVWCPHCLAGHKIKPAEARLEGEAVLGETAPGEFEAILGAPALAGA